MKPSLREESVPRTLESGSQAREYRLIESQLRRRGLWLALPEPLETQFCTSHDAMASAAYSSTIIWALGLFLMVGASVLFTVNTDQLGIWPATYSVFLIFILGGWLLSFSEQVRAQYQKYITALAGLCVFYAVLHPSLLTEGPLRTLIHQGTVFVVLLVYLGINLRFKFALLAGTVSGMLAYPVMWLFDLPMNWDMSIATFLGGSGLGALLRYRDERRTRKLFLQSRLLELDNERIQQLADELERLSFLDGLTGLANRRYFDRMFEKAWRTGIREMHPLSLVMLDVDFFKRYNDHYGHQNGDQCLQEIARAISFVTARPQDLAARYGGEEFVLLFPHTDNLAARHLTSRILEKVRAMEMAHAVSDCADYVTVSAGIATVMPSPDLGMDALLSAADRALYRAKEQGRDRWVSSETLL
ncbi:MAG: GGDEF domain-containing protein [Alcanivoracaceae bacterium]|nr:GGDEF domain-containing protein [Alcanivoracaceae bacterium]